MSASPYSQDIARALLPDPGGRRMPAGLYAPLLAKLAPALTELRAAYENRRLDLLHLPERTEDFPAMEALVAKLRDASDVVFLGTGGSSLGGQTIAQLAGWNVPGVGTLRAGPRVHFLDNLDPHSLDEFLAAVPLRTARFVATSKSGGTGETLLQVMAVIAAYKRAGLEQEIGKRLFGISEPRKTGGKNGLRALFENFGCEVLDHDTGIGGRFIALTNVGLVPALLLGLDAKALRAGAGETVRTLLTEKDAAAIPPAAGAALSVAAGEAGLPISVMLAYGDRFERFSRWWMQLWGESLGKKGKGTTPLASIGPVDQHSQLQLWLDGPRDKLFTVISEDIAGTGPQLEATLASLAGESGFGGKTVGDFVSSQARATADTLAKNQCPLRTISVKKLDEHALGALMMHFMLETILAAHLLGVNPLDQPAVEEGKVLAKRYLAGES